MRARGLLVLVCLGSVGATAGAVAAEVVWRADDARPIAEPAADDIGEYVWWEYGRALTFYQLDKVVDLDHALHASAQRVGLASPREARNVNALDEVPDSTWFTNRHARRRLDPAQLFRGSSEVPPAPDGPLTVLSGKTGATPGFVARDEKGDRYFVKLDAPGLPDLVTGAELVGARIVHALGWNVPEYDLVVFEPARLVLDAAAWTRDRYNRKRPMTPDDLDAILTRADRQADGRIRAVASRYVPGVPKGGFATEGVRPDDPNDVVPHQDRRDLRGLRLVYAWINNIDMKRGNTLDTFLPHPGDPHGRGHLVHYLLDFSTALGAEDMRWKDPKAGHEYTYDLVTIGKSLVTLGLWVKPWERPRPPTHPALGYFTAAGFDPTRWKTAYPQPLFDAATTRDDFWGAKLVTAFTDEDVRTVVRAGAWSDPAAETHLVAILRERRDRVARACFRADRINPVDDFMVEDGDLRWEDLAVRSGIVAQARARYRHRLPGHAWKESLAPEAPIVGARAIELQTSHDGGSSWSPSTLVRLRDARTIMGVERETR